MSCPTPGERLCFRNIFYMDKIVTDEHLTRALEKSYLSTARYKKAC